MSLKKVFDALKQNSSFLVTTHVNMEGDALGSQLALRRLLRTLGKRVSIVNDDAVPAEYAFLPDIGTIVRFGEKSKGMRFDCFVALDCSDISRCGAVARLRSKNKTTINIDHHVSNDRFGDINWVEPDVSSACEMVYRLFKYARIPFDKPTAELLYAGMLTDTGSFHYANTKDTTHKAVAELMRYDLNVQQMYKAAYENIPYQDMVLLGKILSSMEGAAGGRIVWLKINSTVLQKKMSFDLSEHLLSFMRAIKGVEVAVLFKENFGVRNEIRVNFRSQGAMDVNAIAAFFGGGGHRTASGTTCKGSLQSVARSVIKKIKENL